ncbi:MAG: methyltransferase domain-containing protein [Brevefilum sp.]|nr:methyltransferase domain-containing protein [Brevefilum sp.]
MSDTNAYDQFSEDYDRFVNWKARLSLEIPFLASELSTSAGETGGNVSVLDAACGTGHHAIALAAHGFECAGADLSAKMIEIARKNAQAANQDIHFLTAGFGQLSQAFGEQSFDGLICLGNSLPHVLDEPSMIETLADFKAVLRTGGKLIIQNRNFDSVTKDQNRWMDPQIYREGDSTWIFIRFYDFDEDGLITFNILILSSQGGDSFDQQVISTRLWPVKKEKLVQLLELAEFSSIHTYGDLQGSPFSIVSSGNLVITAIA